MLEFSKDEIQEILFKLPINSLTSNDNNKEESFNKIKSNNNFEVNTNQFKRKFSKLEGNNNAKPVIYNKRFKYDYDITDNDNKNTSILKCKLVKQELKNNTSIITKEKQEDIFVDLAKFYLNICKCENCLKLYKLKNIEFIVNSNFIADWKERTLIEDDIKEQTEKELQNTKDSEKFENINNINLLEIQDYKNLTVEKVSSKLRFIL